MRHNWTLFAISYGWDVISGNRSKSAFFEGVGHFERKFQTEGASPINHLRCQNSRMIALSYGIKTSAVYCLIMSQNMRVTDGQTDRQDCNSQDRANIAASCGKNRSSGSEAALKQREYPWRVELHLGLQVPAMTSPQWHHDDVITVTSALGVRHSCR